MARARARGAQTWALLALSSLSCTSVSGLNQEFVRPITRRQLIKSLRSLTSIIAVGANASPVLAGNVREGIANLAGNIPGYGSPDVFYPSYFEGAWLCERTVVGITPADIITDDPLVEAASEEAKALSGVPVKYRARFYFNRGYIILDRSFTSLNLEKAKKDALNSPGKRRPTDSTWEPETPNILTLSFDDGTIREVKVTKRSFEQPSDETFGTSEYQRLAETGAGGPLGGVPVLGASRALSRFRRTGDGRIEGLELMKFYPPVTMQQDPEAILTVKTRMVFSR